MFSTKALSRIRRGLRGACLAGALWMTAAAIELAHLIVGYARISIVPWWILAPGTILALVGMIWGFDGLHNRQAPSRGYGTLGTTGYRIACAGITIGLLESLIRTLALLRTAFIAPGSFGERFLSFVVFSVGYTDINVAILLKSAALLVLSIGFMLWGLASLRAQVVPRWFCVLLGGYFFLLIPTYFVLTPEVVTVRVSPVLDAEIWEPEWVFLHGELGFFCLALTYVLLSTAPRRSGIHSITTSLRAGSLRLWNWSGFSNKTLWDWMGFVPTASIPIVIAVVGLLFNASQAQQNEGIQEKRAQDEALQNYLSEMSKLVTEGELSDPESNKEESSLARARTLVILSRLSGADDPQGKSAAGTVGDTEREKEARSLYASRMGSKEPKGRIVDFLYQSELITKGAPRVSLDKADVGFANLNEANLKNADLREVNLESASLVKADLQGADLRGANLTDTSLKMADIRGADLRDTTAAGLGSRGRGNFENIDQAIGNKETKLPQAQGATIDAQLEKWKKSCDTAFSSPELVGECVSKVESAASDQEQ